jgi:hypothetical protein
VSALERLMDRLPLLRRIRAEQQRRDERTAQLGKRADQLGRKVDAHAERVLRDYRDYGGALHR